MKKILFFLLFVSAVSVHAQRFDERAHVGTGPTPGEPMLRGVSPPLRV